jgi:hypothetical protein
MTLIERIMEEPELKAAPPVFVDVGAAGGMHRAWRRLARHAIGIGFEPDSREAPAPGPAQRQFRRWIFCAGLAVPAAVRDGRQDLFLTRSPQCSSMRRPMPEALGDWAFADFFEVKEVQGVAAVTIPDALAAHGLERIDWLKCDTQGLDLPLYLSLPEAWRRRMLAAEFEPGLVHAYEGEDRLPAVLETMAAEPFWLAELRVGHAARGRAGLLAARLGADSVRWVRRLGPAAPAWANVRYLRNFSVAPDGLGRREWLLGWAITTETGQHGEALAIADEGSRRWGGDLFAAMAAASGRSLRRAMLRALPGEILRRITGGGVR